MTFAWPHLLWLLALPVALSAWDGARRRTRRHAPAKIITAEAGAHELTLTTRAPRSHRPRLWLWFGLAFAIVALARPQWGRLEEPVFDQSREILLAVDLSRSMLAQDVRPSRLERAKLLIQSLLERLQGERVGLIVFSGTAFLQSPLSADYEILREFLPELTPDYLPEGGTNYRALAETALHAFGSATAADRFLIILSDGEATDDDWKPAAAELQKKGVRVIGLGIGTETGAMIPDGHGGFVKDERGAVVLSRLGQSTLEQLAQLTSGTYADASAWVDLAAVLRQTVEAGRKGRFLEKNTIRLAERFQWALAPALLCFLLSVWREFPVRPRPRDLRPARSSASSAPAATTLAAVAFLLAGLLLAPAARAAAEPVPPAATSTLGPMVARLSAQDEHSARDWSELAHETLRWGQRLQAAQQPVPEGPVTDALAAVDLGEKRDPAATDWPKLRHDLETLRLKPESPPHQPPPQKKDSDQQKSSDQQQQQDKSQSDSSPQQQQQNPSQPEEQKRDSSDQNASSSPSSHDQKDQPSPEKSSPDQKKTGESAFGDMKDRPPPSPPQPASPPSGDTQTVGGTRDKKESAPADADPALALPLQKLDQLRNQDSPARLFQLMDGDSQRPPATSGKNW